MIAATGNFVSNIKEIVQNVVAPYLPAFETAIVIAVTGTPNRSITIQRISSATADTNNAKLLGSYVPKAGDTVLCARMGTSSLVVLGKVGSVRADPYFISPEITGNGAEQNTAHGLGATPRFVFAAMTSTLVASAVIVEGAHDATNVKITATSGARYRVIAFL